MQENEGEEKINSCQQENEETHTAENEEIFAQETENKGKNEDEESIPHESEETEHAEQRVSFTRLNEQENKLKMKCVLHKIVMNKKSFLLLLLL